MSNHLHEYSTIASEWIKLEKLTYLLPSDKCAIFFISVEGGQVEGQAQVRTPIDTSRPFAL